VGVIILFCIIICISIRKKSQGNVIFDKNEQKPIRGIMTLLVLIGHAWCGQTLPDNMYYYFNFFIGGVLGCRGVLYVFSIRGYCAIGE
jgi:hypothetical protein